MAIFILGPDPDGNCCECNVRTNPCDSCEEIILDCALSIAASTLEEAQGIISADIKDCALYCVVVTDATTSDITGEISENGQQASVECSASSSGFAEASYETKISVSCSANTLVTFVTNLSFTSISATRTPTATMSIFGNGSIVCSQSGDFRGEPENTQSLQCTIVDEGIYIITLGLSVARQAPFPSYNLTSINASSLLSFDKTVAVNPAIVIYDDSGTTRQLEACPKLQIPISIFSPQSYGTQALAQAAINSRVSNCIGFYPGSNNFITFTVTDNSSSVVIDATSQPQSFFGWPTISMWTSFVFQPLTTLNLAYNITGTDSRFVAGRVMAVSISVYDLDGTLIDSDSVTSNWPTDQASHNMTGSVNLSIPNFGHYYIFCSAGGSGGGAPTPEELSGTMTLSTNTEYECLPVQARYTNETECPSLLDCT